MVLVYRPVRLRCAIAFETCPAATFCDCPHNPLYQFRSQCVCMEDRSMTSPILVAYTTLSGSTGEVAEAIGVRLNESGLKTDLARMKDLKSIGDRVAVILGAPLYMGGLPAETRRFLLRNQNALASLKTWFFVLGPIEGKPEEYISACEQAEKWLEKFTWLQPIDMRVFGGKFDVRKMPFPYSLARYLPAFPAKNLPAKDIRDWVAIRAWADEIVAQLALVPSTHDH